MKHVDLLGLTIGNDLPLTVISGPCQLETLDHALMIGETLKAACLASGVGYVFKASYDKANRTSLSSKRGPGKDGGLAMLSEIRRRLDVPVLTDVHRPEDCADVARACDIVQIPAFLCRQTDLLLAAGETGAAVNVKKGQFLAPWDIPNVIAKIESTGNTRILLTERGSSFGYNVLVADMRSLAIMGQTGYPVVMDATHAVASPGGRGASSGGQREFAPLLARAAVAAGVAAVFLETHEDPENAPSDGPNSIYLSDMPALIETLAAFDRLAKFRPLWI